MLSFSADQLWALNISDDPPSRSVRKAIFSLQLWWPKRRHAVTRQNVNNNNGGSERRAPKNNDCYGLSFGLLNARSVSNKSTAISDTIVAQNLDVLAITEPWHRASTDLPLKRCAPPGFAIVDTPRLTGLGGGVALIFDKRFVSKKLCFATQPSTFEVVGCLLRSTSSSAVHVVIYRPGSKAPSESFFDELIELLEIVAAYRCQIVVSGDFNIHVNNSDDRHAQRLAEILESFDLIQTVTGPTHSDGNTLDLVVTRRDCQPVSCTVQPPGVISDHSLIICRFPSTSFAVQRVTRLIRPWKKLDKVAFVSSLRSSILCTGVTELSSYPAEKLFDIYDNTIRRIVDKHVPAYSASVRDRRLTPWFDAECRASRRLSRMHERRYRKNTEPR